MTKRQNKSYFSQDSGKRMLYAQQARIEPISATFNSQSIKLSHLRKGSLLIVWFSLCNKKLKIWSGLNRITVCFIYMSIFDNN